MRIRLPIALGLAALALAGAGCGDDEDDTGGGQAGTTPTDPRPATTAAPPKPTATTPSAGRSAVTIAGNEFAFSPKDVRVRAGQVTFRLRNTGGAPHAIEIEGNGIEEESDVVQGGETTELRVSLRPGRYVMYCPVGNHREMGMEGQVTVS